MKTKLAICLMLGTLLALPSLANAERNGYYVSVKFLDSLQNTGAVGGDDGLSSKTLNSVGVAAAVGLHLRDLLDSPVPLRLEFEYANRTKIHDSWKGSLSGGRGFDGTWQVQTFQINGYYDIEVGGPLVPYVGAGIGLSSIYGELTSTSVYTGYRHSSSDISCSLAWNVGAGVAYELNPNVALDVGYRFAGFGSSTVRHNSSDINNYLTANEFSAGLRFSF